jgi:mRNA interferase HigB
VRVISRKALRQFWEIHPDAEVPLRAWFTAASRGVFRSLPELRRTFASVDYVGAGNSGLYVFNIGGNKCRLIAAVHFNTQKVFVRRVLTHAQYDRSEWKT